MMTNRHPEGGYVTDGRTDGGTTVPTEPTRAARRAKKPQYRQERRVLMAEVAAAVARHHLPAIPEIPHKQVFLSGCLSLLQGGYSPDLVRTVAIATALEYTDVRGHSRLMQIRLRVRAEQAKIDQAEHARKKSGLDATPLDDAVCVEASTFVKQQLAAMRRPSGIECVVCGQPADSRCSCGVPLHPKACAKQHRCSIAAILGGAA